MSRLAVFELHHLGDAVMALPFLRAARQEFEVTVFARPAVADLLRAATKDLDILSAPASWPGRASLARKLRLTSSDVAVCVWADARVHLLMKLTGAGRRVGFPMTPVNYYAAELPWRRRRLLAGQFIERAAGVFGPLLTHPLARQSYSQHHMKDWQQTATALGITCQEAAPWIDIPSTLPEKVAAFLQNHQGYRHIVVHAGGRQPEKRWPHFQALLHRLATQADLAITIVEASGEPSPSPIGPHQHAFRASSWPGLFGLFSAVDAVVCNDSFASHLAAAFGKPVVTLFGSGNPDWFAPYHSEHLVVVPEGRVLYPIIDHGTPPGSVHLDAIPVDLVERRLRTAANAG